MRRLLVVAAVLTLVVAISPATASAKKPTPAPSPANDISKLQHIVVLMQENRSYDQYFAPLHFEGQPKSDVQSQKPNPNPLGGPPIHPFLKTDGPCEVADLDHSWTATHNEIDGGKMDGFTAANAIPQDPTGSRAMGHYDQRELPFYYSLANQFSIAERYFASVPGPTFPNRFYLLTGTSFGHIRNDIAIFNQKTIFQALDEAGITWKIYEATFQVEDLFAYVQAHPQNKGTIQDYDNDAAAGTLPQVSFVESNPGAPFPGAETDEHPPSNVQVGEKFVHDRIQALVNGPEWSSSAFFLTYDEHGGYYDHVSPPAAVPPDDIPPMLRPGDTPAGFDQYGVRVPAMVISPYAKPHNVSDTIYDHTSILKTIETRFGVPPLTRRDAAANSMLDMFDFSHESNPSPTLVDAPVDPAGVAQCAALHP